MCYQCNNFVKLSPWKTEFFLLLLIRPHRYCYVPSGSCWCLLPNRTPKLDCHFCPSDETKLTNIFKIFFFSYLLLFRPALIMDYWNSTIITERKRNSFGHFSLFVVAENHSESQSSKPLKLYSSFVCNCLSDPIFSFFSC